MPTPSPTSAEISHQFDRLCDIADMAYSERYKISFEASLVAILNFITSHSDSRSLFASKSIHILHSKTGLFEAVAFCMRELQWHEILEQTEEWVRNSKSPRSQSFRSLIEANDEDWPDSDLFSYYS